MFNTISAVLIAIAVIAFEIATEPTEPSEPSEPMPEPMPEPVSLLTEAEIYRAHRVHAAVLGAKFALRHNNPAGYANASEEMRKYI